jgi:hypothetical protein
MRQHDAHVSARIEHLIRSIHELLGIVEGCDLADWYACGDDLI